MSPTLFPALLAGHLLGDWVAQNDWEASNKTRSWPALAAHVASYHLVMGVLLLIPVLRDGWPVGKALVVLAVSAGTHALIDRRAPVRMLMRAAGSPGFATLEWGVIAVDQALHLSILSMLAALLGLSHPVPACRGLGAPQRQRAQAAARPAAAGRACRPPRRARSRRAVRP
jgi:hypothetical protein